MSLFSWNLNDDGRALTDPFSVIFMSIGRMIQTAEVGDALTFDPICKLDSNLKP